MSSTRVTTTVSAPPELVFDVVANIENFSKISDQIVNVEFLSEQTSGVGTRFRETRLMRGREATTTLEVTEYNPPNSVRIVSDEGGTIWDTVFSVEATPDGSTLDAEMEARPYKLLARLVTPLLGPMLRKAIAADMKQVKDHCEQQASR